MTRPSRRLPRGNGTLMLCCVFHDIGEKIYRNLCKLADTPKGALAFMREYIDRTEGRPVKKIEKTQQRVTNFILTTPDDQRQPLFPWRQMAGNGATRRRRARRIVWSA